MNRWRALRAGFGAVACVGAVAAPSAMADVSGTSNGNHDLGCRVIAPSGSAPVGGFPLIVWADGWYQGEVNGRETTAGYREGLEGWADNGWMVVAATQWSARSTDVLRCLTWALSSDSGVADDIDESKIGLAGHSQGGGAVLKAADGIATGRATGPTQPIGSFDITAVIAMNPYGPSFPDLAGADGPILFLGGSADTTTPTSSFIGAFESAVAGNGALLAELDGGTHNSEAWGSPPVGTDFGSFQLVSEAWWSAMFDDDPSTGVASVCGGLSSPEWSMVDCGDSAAPAPMTGARRSVDVDVQRTSGVSRAGASKAVRGSSLLRRS